MRYLKTILFFSDHKKKAMWLLAFGFFLLITPETAQAYIGPGAGFALLSSLFALLASFVLAFFSLILLPFRLILAIARGKRAYTKAKAKRVVILGFDGLDPELCQKYLEAGKLPNFGRLKEQGCFKKLATTFPALSPVAWSTFATGVNPGRHKIYDFLMRNKNTYLPELSSAKIGSPKRVLKVGSYRIPLSKPTVNFLRKSKSFWKVLGEAGIFSHIVRVPITFPPEKFRGAMLSAMCTPDLRGTQGTFSFYTLNKNGQTNLTSGTQLPLKRQGHKLMGELIGPENFIKNSKKPVTLPFVLSIAKNRKEAKLELDGQKIMLKQREFTPWIKVSFKPGLALKIRGICQFYLKEISPNVELYVSPINIDPERPALPLSYPSFFSHYLAKLFGSYGTLGMAEDTWSLNEQVLDEDAFLDQAYRIHNEREKQFFHALQKTKSGVCACVFDATDRIQHMFFRYLMKGHPANNNKDSEKYKHVIPELYQRADELLGRVMAEISEGTLLMVISDHGFKSFVRGINLNSWLHQNGYLKLKNGDFSADYFQNVDWKSSQAYAVGLAGIYLNIKGREKFGCVEPGEEAKKLKQEITQKLTGTIDPDNNRVAINDVYDSKKIYSGAYVDDAPDLVIGYNDGYRISWDAAIGKTTKTVFEDNTKCWSGDHGIDPNLVPGVLFCNRKIETPDPNIVDIAPTLVQLFGLRIPTYMDGKPLEIPDFKNDSTATERE